MSQPEIEQRLRTIFVDQLGVTPEQVTPEANLLDDLGCDSLDHIELALNVEEQFGFAIDDDDLEKLNTFGDWVTHVTGELEAKAHA